MSDGPTPETDDCAKGIDQSNFEDSWKDDFEEFAWVPADFARRLERERDLWKAEAERWREIKGWHPIETAPRDGTEILVYAGKRDGVCVAYFGRTSLKWHSSNSEGGVCYPLHWMPLPEPPQ